MTEVRDSSEALAQLRSIATAAPPPVSHETLHDFLASQVEFEGCDFQVVLPDEAIAAGASGGLLMFEIAACGGADRYSGRYVLRYELGTGGFFSQTSLPSQFEIMRAIHARGIPCAQAMWLDTEGRIAGGATSMIMRRVEARPPVIQYVQAGAFVDATDGLRETMIRSLMANLVKIHALPLDNLKFDLLGDRSGHDRDFLVNQVDWALRELHERFPESEEGERAAFHQNVRQTLTDIAERLKRVAPPGARPVLVHGDPTIANTMFNDYGGVAAILDWELAHAGLAAEDLFYFVYAAQSIACLGNVRVNLPVIEDVVRYYLEAGGKLEHIEFGSAIAAFAITVWGSIGLRRMPKEFWEAQRLTWETQSAYLKAAMDKLPA